MSSSRGQNILFEYCRIVRFADTDAAGVVYFAQILSICHEAYEASLAQAGLPLSTFFSHRGTIAVPIIHASADFRHPLVCGDALLIRLNPVPISPASFEIRYEVLQGEGKVAAIATTRHVCIDPTTRQRQPLTPELTQWLHQGLLPDS